MERLTAPLQAHISLQEVIVCLGGELQTLVGVPSLRVGMSLFQILILAPGFVLFLNCIG